MKIGTAARARSRWSVAARGGHASLNPMPVTFYAGSGIGDRVTSSSTLDQTALSVDLTSIAFPPSITLSRGKTRAIDRATSQLRHGQRSELKWQT